ncbi:hypothetical protein SD70_32125 [Gordoniibacillus kamchatkensis]|uniref:Uncharacterized protein n=1 Tax=Gordoniibacillus kamchatkensis TaxID=1590651 RepID=A0ABR5A3G7_9BACL|nr:hypothetical protein [Paenibacillus sp. VKM B-2647]KIL35580.1 hypothetical protein SD70_32125 [Paenibacillus sp. VKM B-2647]
MAETSDREKLSAILKAVETTNANVDAFAEELTQFRKEMNEFRRETTNSFNKVDRRLRFLETDYEQLNERVDKLELSGKSH